MEANKARGVKSAWTAVSWADFCYWKHGLDQVRYVSANLTRQSNENQRKVLDDAIEDAIEVGETLKDKFKPKQGGVCRPEPKPYPQFFGNTFTSKEELSNQYSFYLDGKTVRAFGWLYKSLYHARLEEQVKGWEQKSQLIV
jgi:hypothetical protein